MAIRSKTLFTLTAVIVGYVALLAVCANYLSERGLTDIENTAVEEAVSRFRTELDDVSSRYASNARDWGLWKETYSFVRGESPDYPATYLGEHNLANLNVNLMAFLDMDGKVLASRWIDLKGQEDPEDRTRDVVVTFNTGWSVAEGGGVLVTGPGDPFLAAMHPVRQREGKEAIGCILLARRLDREELKRISEKISARAFLVPNAAVSIPADEAENVSRLSGRLAVGETWLKTPRGRIVAAARVELDRTLYQLGRKFLGFWMLLLLASGVVFAAFVSWYLERALLNRLARLDLEITRLGKDTDHVEDAQTDDEISHLAHKVNELVDAERKAARDLARSQRLFQALFEKAGESIFILKADEPDKGAIVAANPEAARSHGYSEDEIRALNISEIDAPQSQEQMQEVLGKINSGEWVRTELFHRRKDGSTFPVEVSGGLLEVEGSRFVLGFDRDITERRRFEEDLRRERERAEEASRLKSEFLSNVTHELRTPLNSILGYAELLDDGVDGPLNDKQRDDLTRVTKNARLLLHHIEEILDFSRIESEKLVLDSHAFSLRESVAETVRMVRILADKKGLDLKWSVDQEAPDLLMGDEKRLRQVVMNLLDNAVKFTEKGWVELDAGYDAAASSEGGGVVLRFTVSDTGIGIAEAVVPRIFDAFVQGDGSTRRRYGGSGLGLAIVARLVEKMGGEISVAPREGGGTVFMFNVRMIRALEG